MDISYTWNFNSLEIYTAAYGKTDVVVAVNWKLIGNYNSYENYIEGKERISYNPDSEFISYDQLTYNIVYDWVVSSIGTQRVQSYMKFLEKSILSMGGYSRPSVEVKNAPWQN